MDEKTQILTILESARQSLYRMFADVTEEQARATPTASALCLGGILKHVAYGETIWIDFVVDGQKTDDLDRYFASFRMEPGETVTLTKDFVLPAGDPEVTNVGTATGTDVLGTKVSDNDDAFVTIVKAENPPPAPPPTAFTGSDAARLGLIAGVLLALGLLGIVLGRKRREA